MRSALGSWAAWFRRKKVKSAAEVGLCCMSSGFPISQGNAEALDR